MADSSKRNTAGQRLRAGAGSIWPHLLHPVRLVRPFRPGRPFRVVRPVRGLICAVAIAAQLTGCGYLIFPERTGQPAGQIDWGVVGLDAVGLLFGVAPGLIAFAVDFATGCIYLPPHPYRVEAAPLAAASPQRWRLIAELGPAPSLGQAVAAVEHHVASETAVRLGPFRKPRPAWGMAIDGAAAVTTTQRAFGFE